jgi:hypothetical protein
MNKNITFSLLLLLLISLIISINSVPNQRFRQNIRRPFRNDQLRILNNQQQQQQQQQRQMPNIVSQQHRPQPSLTEQAVEISKTTNCPCKTEMKHLTDFLIPAAVVNNQETIHPMVPMVITTSTVPTSTFKLFGLDMVV